MLVVGAGVIVVNFIFSNNNFVNSNDRNIIFIKIDSRVNNTRNACSITGTVSARCTGTLCQVPPCTRCMGTTVT